MTDQTASDRAPAWRAPLAWLTDPAALPRDVLEDEITEIALFRLSLLLNRATGGAPGMTFSARTALACTGGGVRGRLWQVPRMAIDTWCRLRRSEIAHCARALDNYHRRRG